MEKLSITKLQACRFILSYQGLYGPYTLKGKSGVMEYIRRVGCIQFDPLNIAGCNHELVLQSRVSDFKASMPQELLYLDRCLLDGFDKNMSIFCIEDWPYFGRRREAFLQKLGNTEAVNNVVPRIREELELRGPLSSADLDYGKSVDWWWGTPSRVSKAALECMYYWGELVVHHKSNTRRYFDFSYKLIPEQLYTQADPNMTTDEYHDWYVKRRIGAIGMLWAKSGDAWLGMGEIKSRERSEAIKRLLMRNELIEVNVDGLSAQLYMPSSSLPMLQEVLSTEAAGTRASVLAPLDNMLWDRKLIQELFGFEYRWEVYKPEAERQYGYYVLPVLCGDRFAARFEPGWDKKTNSLVIKNWWWEPGIKKTKKLEAALTQCFSRFLSCLEADKLQISTEIMQEPSLNWLCELKSRLDA